jgi:dolichol-phosphate mannosyltransferase
MQGESVAVVVPTYNEAGNIESLLEQILAQEGIDLAIVVDDNSPDGTAAIAGGLAAQHPGRVEVVRRPAKLGLGTAYVAGFRRAFERGAGRVITMDADFSHQPGYLPALLDLSERCDLVIGSRYVPGGGARNCSLFRRFLSRGANATARLALGLQAHDCTAGFRCYRTGLLMGIDLEGIRSSGYSFLIEMLYLCQQAGAVVGELPIVFVDRRHGRSKISQAEIVKAWQTVGRLSAHRLLNGRAQEAVVR